MNTTATLASLQSGFLALMPAIEAHARIYFRHLRCPHEKADALAETTAICWRWYVRLKQRGKDPSQFRSALATLAARAVRCGRRLCGQAKAKDALNAHSQQAHGFTVSSLPAYSTLGGTPLEEALQDNTQTPVPDQVSFRQDFPAWRSTRTERDRRLVDDLMLGERTNEVAGRFGISSARVSQLRREFMEDWKSFCGEPVVV